MPKLGLGFGLPTTKISAGFNPKSISGLKLWVSADYGITKGVSFINEIDITGCDPNSSDGVYTRGEGGTAPFYGPGDNEIYYDGEGNWILYDDSVGGATFNNFDNLDEGTWDVLNGESFGSATNSLDTDTDAVLEVQDRSGNSNNLTNSISTYISNNIINGKPAFHFNGGRLIGDDIVTGKTIYAVIKTKATPPSQYAAILELTGGGLYSAILGTARWGSYFGTEIAVNTALSANTAYIIGSLSDKPSTTVNYKFRQNGSQVKSGTSSNYVTRSGLYFGNDGSGGQAANCYVAEAIIYDREVTTDEAEKIENYLNSKYAIY
jgi:hypothetical protein